MIVVSGLVKVGDMTPQQMSDHIDTLIGEHGITVDWRRSARGMSWMPVRKIRIARVTTERSYAVALHEIGHCAAPSAWGRHPRLDKELAAWDWAERNALEWTDRMDEERAKAMGWYVQRARRHRWPLPPAGHRLWQVAY